MENPSQQDANSQRPPTDPAQQLGKIGTGGKPRKRSAFQFGLVEFQGVLVAIAGLGTIWMVLFSEPDLPRGHPLRDADRGAYRAIGLAFSTVIALGGTYLSSRLATRYRIRRAWRRLFLQIFCTVFLFPPLLCLAAFVLPFLAHWIARELREEPDSV